MSVMIKSNLSYATLLSVTFGSFASAYMKNKKMLWKKYLNKSYKDKIKSLKWHYTLYLQNLSNKFHKYLIKIEEILVSRNVPYFYLILCPTFWGN